MRATLLLLLYTLGATSSNQCNYVEKNNLALVAIHEPASLLQMASSATNMQQCVDLCCTHAANNQLTGKDCNAVSFYLNQLRFLCVLLSCHPFDKCSWKPTEQQFYAAYISINKTAIVPTTTTTTATTTTSTTTTTTTTTTTRAPVVPLVIDQVDKANSTPQIAETQPRWNILEDLTSTTKKLTTPLTLPHPQSSTQTYGIPKQTAHAAPPPPLPPHVDQSEAEKPGQTIWVMKNVYALIGVVCLVCLLVLLLGVGLKRQRDKQQGKPQYRQLRDYDVRVEPPASGASLLAT